MKKIPNSFIFAVLVLLITSLACQTISPAQSTAPPASQVTEPPTDTSTPLPTSPVDYTEANQNEPVSVSGSIPYTSPFFLDTVSEAFVLLEDQAGFIDRNLEFEFPLPGQAIGPVIINDDASLTYFLSLPAVPQGTMVDVDNNGIDDSGVQVFAVAYWSNTWGGPFLEERDGTGWSSAYASTQTEADLDYEIVGGTLIVWSPDDQQAFPTGFGPDDLLFTDDDPTDIIPAGYNIINLDSEPFKVYKESQPVFELIEGDIAVTDYADLSYEEAFDALFEKASREYPFTPDKDIDWDALYETYAPQIADASNDREFFIALHNFSLEIPDGHIGVSFTELVSELFFTEYGGSFGMVLAELSDGRIIVKEVFPNTPASSIGIQVGAEIQEWDGQPVQEVLDATESFFGPYSTEQHRRLEELIFLTRVPASTRVEVTYQNPDEDVVTNTMRAEVEYDSMFAAIPSFSIDEMELPVYGEVLDDSGLGYIRVSTFSDDYNLIAQLWDRYIKNMIELGVPGLIIDIRVNGGGSSGLANNFAGYFYETEEEVSRRSYYNDLTGGFEVKEPNTRIKPAPVTYPGEIAVIVSPYCISACEGFAYALSRLDQVNVIGHYPTSGAFGEVGRGQYDLPAGLSMQFPTGRSETPSGDLLIEGSGVEPDVMVPVTYDSVVSGDDVLLQEAIDFLIEEIN